jgi:adenylate cyclase
MEGSHSPDTCNNIHVTAQPRYQIVEIIGRGGMGEVYLADDVMLDRKVALKFVNAPGDSDGLEQLLGEARAAAALDHPFICSIYEVTTLNGRACIAMEYVRGESLERRLRGGPLPLGEALRVAEEVAEALDAAHKRRVVHRDLKPANVMLTEDGHIKVMDFGLAARLPHTDVDQAETVAIAATDDVIVGTPAYMAPEQIRAESADRRSDIFAFGILLYELISGRNPFVRAGIDATFAAVLNEQVAALRDQLPTTPLALDALAARLLAKDPAARHQSFGDVRSILRRLLVDLSSSAALVPTAIVDPQTNDGGIKLIGREPERAQLLQSLHQARSGSGSLILLLGDAGVGKTRLAEEALAMARRLGCQTLVGRCYEQPGTPALIPYTEVLEEASRLMPATAFRQAIMASAPELAKLMPELRRLFPDLPPPLELPPELRQRYLFTNVREFLTRSSRSTPLAIFIDDLQWADESTLQLTQHMAQHLASLPIVMIVACREVEAAPTISASRGTLHNLLDRVRGQSREVLTPQAIKAALDRMVGQRNARPIVLRPFTPADVQSVLTSLGKPNPPARLVRTFADHTGGNPFFVVELFRHLKEEGRLFDARHHWTRDLDWDDVELPNTVRVVLERRMQRVSPDTQNFLNAAAVIGRHFEPDLLEEVASADSDTLMAALREAEQARIVIGPSGRRDITWRFAHQLTCQMLTAAIPQTRRQRLHLRVADAMTRLNRDSRAHLSGIAHHLYWAGRLADPSRASRALITAGDAAHAMYASEEAAQHYRRALEVMEEANGHNPARLAVQERLADVLALLGDRRTAMEHYERVHGEYRAARTAVDQARIARKTGTLHWQAGDRAEAMASYRRALELLSGSTAHIEAAQLYEELGLAAFRSGDNQKAVEWAERALQSAERALTEPAADTVHVRTATTAIAQATNTIGVALARSGQLDAARERIERSLASAQDLGLLDVACRAYANLGVIYSSLQPKRAIDVSLAGLEIASKIGAASLQSYIYANLAAAYCALTERCDTEGLEAANAAAELDRELGQLDHLAVPLVVIAQIHQCRGELHKAESVYREALALAEKIGEPQLILPCYDGLATIYLDRGDRVRAEELMERARRLCEQNGLDPDTLLLLPFLC